MNVGACDGSEVPVEVPRRSTARRASVEVPNGSSAPCSERTRVSLAHTLCTAPAAAYVLDKLFLVALATASISTEREGRAQEHHGQFAFSRGLRCYHIRICQPSRERRPAAPAFALPRASRKPRHRQHEPGGAGVSRALHARGHKHGEPLPAHLVASRARLILRNNHRLSWPSRAMKHQLAASSSKMARSSAVV